MWRKSVARNQGIFNGGKKAFKTVRKVAVSSFQPPYEASIQYRESASTAPFSTAAAAAAVVPTSTMKSSDTKSDAVQNAFRVLHNERSDSAKFIMTERLDDFEKLIIEAKQSINDCIEGDEDLLEEDRETAKDAVREAVDVFDDISYDFSRTFSGDEFSDDESNDIIKSFAAQLDELKKELDLVLGETKRGNLLVGLDKIMNRIINWRS